MNKSLPPVPASVIAEMLDSANRSYESARIGVAEARHATEKACHADECSYYQGKRHALLELQKWQDNNSKAALSKAKPSTK